MNVALKHIGALLSDEQLVEKLPASFKKVIAIELEEKQEETGYRFKRVSLETFDVENYSKYLYKRGGTSGAGVTLTCKLGKANRKDKKQKTPKAFADTAVNKKVIGYLRKMIKKAATEAGRKFSADAVSALEEGKAAILERVTDFAEQLAPEKDEDAIVTLVVSNMKDLEDRKYPDDIAPLHDYFRRPADSESDEQEGKRSIGQNAICSCCSKLSERVYCRPPDLKLPYFTFDKPGFVSGGFFSDSEIQNKAWRNLPLCADCEAAIRRGFRSVEEKLRFSLCRTKGQRGFDYLLIPNFTDWQSPNTQTVVQMIANLGQATDTSLQRDQEVLFAHRLSGEENTVSFTFLFYRKKLRLEILCTLENVLPSRLSEIAGAVDRAERHDLLARFGIWTKATKIGAIPVNFGLLKDFYQPRLKTRGDKPVGSFLRAVQRVVYGQPFDSREFFDSAMRYIRDEMREQQSRGKEPWLTLAAHRSLAVAFWLLHLNLLRFAPASDGAFAQRGDAMIEYPRLNADNLNVSFEEFFQTFSGLFQGDDQKACYLMGVLCAKVLDIQWHLHQGRQPFFRHLKGLNLDEAKIHELLWRLKAKLVEYERDFYGGLERAIAERFRLSRSPWRTTSSEISFFFTLGMCEAQLFSFTPTTEEDPS